MDEFMRDDISGPQDLIEKMKAVAGTGATP
jgi:hypothetical protein